tara:strand:- start:469 stop:2196 length:1728 start_codon:yes stop_codon:yes gene_type:complete
MLQNYLKLFRITKGSDRKKFFVLIFLLIILTILETVGVGIVIPVIAILLDEELLKNYKIGKDYYIFIQNFNFFFEFNNFREKIIILSSIIVILFFFLKFLFTIFITYFQQYFLFNFHQNISSDLLKSFVKRDINFHLNKNSSELISDLIEEINEIISVYSSYILFFTEIIIFIFVSMLVLFSVKLQGIVILSFFLVIGMGILLYTKKKLVKLGGKRQFHFAARFNSAKDLLNSIKEIKILGVENFFINKFNVHNRQLNKTAIPKRIYIVFPRTLLEFVAVMAIFLITIVLSSGNIYTSQEIIFVIGLIVTATIKIFPSVSKIISSVQTIKFGNVAINKVSNYLEYNYQSSNNRSLEEINFKKNIHININNFKYPGSEKSVLNNLKIDIQKNQCIGIFGDSGVGKSTLVDIIMGLQILDNKANILEVDNKNIYKSVQNWRKKFGYVGQTIHFLNDSIEKNIAFGIEEKNIDNGMIMNSLRKAEILDFVNEHPKKINSILGEDGLNISGGQRQRLGIARALYQDPEILVFDEATSSLDIKNEKLVMQTINSYKGSKTMIIISHKIENLSFCDQIIKL